MKYAHSLPDTPASQWQSLEDHLKNVAELAGTFASDFSSSSIAELLGLVHNDRKAGKWHHYTLNSETLHGFKSFIDTLSCVEKGDDCC